MFAFSRIAAVLLLPVLAWGGAVSGNSPEPSKPPSLAAPAPVAELKRAANGGDEAAMCTLGDYYRKGLHVKKNLSQALQWYVQAAKAGSATGQYRLAQAYHLGLGTDSNQISACIWSSLAAEHGTANLQQITELKEKTCALLTPEQRERSTVVMELFRKQVSVKR